jgi:TP901 family phage tail tape measure protein
MAENYSIVTDVNAGNSLAVLDQIVNKVMQVESAIGKASGQKLQIDAPGANNMLSGWTSQLSGSKGNFANVGKELGQSLTMGMQQQFGMAGGVATSLAGALGGVGIAAVAGVAGLTALGAASVNAARGWESLMAGVSKTTGAEGAALTQLSNTLLNLSKEMPIAQAEIAKIATVGGTLGVKQSDLPKFVKDTAMASAGWGMSGEEAANSIAGISNAFKVPIADAQKFGSVINTMADQVGGSEKELADFLVRASGIATTFNEGIASTTAFGAVLASINMPMEVAATGLQSMMAFAMAPASPERLEQWAGMMNVTVDQLKAKLEQDLYGTLIESSNAIATVGTETEQQQARIAIWGEGGARVSSGLVGMQNKYTEALKSANEQLKTGSSLAQAFGAQGATVDAKWQKFTNTMTTALIHLGTAALPVLGQVLDTMSGLIAKADEFAATTLPAWAQGATDWVNETLGMTEDTPEQIAERKAKIARTAEKTATKVAGTTGYQSYSEAQASAANLGQGTGNSYVDGLNSALDTGLPKALTDAYLGDALKTGKTAAASAGKQTAEEFTKSQDEYIKSHSSGSYTSTMMQQMASQQSKSYSTINKVIDTITFPDEYNIRNVRDKGRDYGTLQAEDATGNVLSSMKYQLQRSAKIPVELQFENVKKSLMAEIRPVIFDMPKYLRQAGGDISDSLTDILSDGVVSFTEKNELGEYIRSLDELNAEFPIEFKAANLDEIKRDVQATLDGVDIKVNLDAESFAISAAEYIDEHFALYSKMYGKGYVAQKPDEEAYFKLMEGYRAKGDDEVVSQLQDIDTIIETGDRNQAEVLNSKLEYVVKAHPELIDQTAFLSRVALADETMLSDTMVQNGHLSFIQSASESTSTNTKDTVVAINNLANIVGSGGFSTTVVNAYAEGTTANQNLKVSQMAAAKSTGTPLKFSTVSLSSAKALANEFGIPGFETGAVKVQPPGGLAFIGEGAETEYVFTESQIKGLYPDFAKAAKGSMKWLTGEQYFEDYPGARISAPTSYRWSSYPDAPQVQQLHTENMQTAWLSEGQPTGLDMISSEIRALQLASIGKSQVQPWFARGEIKQPDWWVEKATELSPKYASNWAANKGGTVPKIVPDTETATAATEDRRTVREAYFKTYGDNFCINPVEPDQSLNYIPSASYLASLAKKDGESTRAAISYLYGENFTEGCIEANDIAEGVFTPSNGLLAEVARSQGASLWGSGLAGSASTSSGNEVSGILDSIDANTHDTKVGIDTQIDVLKLGIFATPGMQEVKGTFSTAGANDLVTGLSKEGYVVSYDPRTDTCEGLSFNAPEPTLVTTDYFYLGLTKNSPYRSEDKAPGYGWKNVAQTNDPALQQLMKIDEETYKESQKTKDSSQETAKNTNDIYRTLGQQYALQKQALAVDGTAANALVTMAGGGGSSGLYGRTAGSFWGGLSVGGGGGWVGTGASMSGWGAQASAAASSGQSSTFGSVQWAEGGITDHPVYGVFGEAGREAFVPISDRSAGLRILPQVMRELGVRTFATGGIVGSGGLSTIMESIGGTSIGQITVINHANEPVNEEKLAKKILEQVAKKTVLSARRRG